MIIVRECCTSDYNKIHELNKSAFGYQYSLKKTRDRLHEVLERAKDKIFVACVDNEVVGYIHGIDYECTYSDPLKNIVALAVDQAYRGKGIGRILLKTVENWARESNCCGVCLISGFDRINAHQFYLHCGYNDRKDQKNFVKLF